MAHNYDRLRYPQNGPELIEAAAVPDALIILTRSIVLPAPASFARGVVLLGMGHRVSGHGLRMNRTEGVLVSNVYVYGVEVDGLEIKASHNIVVEGCTFGAAGDGLVDINGGSQGVRLIRCRFVDGMPRGVLVGNWQKPAAERVRFEQCTFDNVPVRCPKVDRGASVVLLDHTVRNYRQHAVDVRDGATVEVYGLADGGGPKAHGPLVAEPGATVIGYP